MNNEKVHTRSKGGLVAKGDLQTTFGQKFLVQEVCCLLLFNSIYLQLALMGLEPSTLGRDRSAPIQSDVDLSPDFLLWHLLLITIIHRQVLLKRFLRFIYLRLRQLWQERHCLLDMILVYVPQYLGDLNDNQENNKLVFFQGSRIFLRISKSWTDTFSASALTQPSSPSVFMKGFDSKIFLLSRFYSMFETLRI